MGRKRNLNTVRREPSKRIRNAAATRAADLQSVTSAGNITVTGSSQPVVQGNVPVLTPTDGNCTSASSQSVQEPLPGSSRPTSGGIITPGSNPSTNLLPSAVWSGDINASGPSGHQGTAPAISPPGQAVNPTSVVPSLQTAGTVGSMDPKPPGPSQTFVHGESISQSHSTLKVSPLASVCSPLGDHIQQSLRDKIARHEFIDLGLCLENWSSNKPIEGLCVSVDEQGRPVLKSQEKPTIKINTISAWTSAFLVYAAVYLSYHPQRAQEILKYMHTVRSAAIRFGSYGWRQYDINFRMRQQRNPQNSWGNIDSELWFLFVVAPPATRTAAIPRVPISQGSVFHPSQQRGFKKVPAAKSRAPSRGLPGLATHTISRAPCFGFNKPEGCKFAQCRFSHVCSACHKPGHTALVCKTRPKL